MTEPSDDELIDERHEEGEPADAAANLDLDLEESAEPEGALVLDAGLDVEDGQLAYDCAAWAGETRSLLKSLLVTNGIPHAWQGTTLTVRDEHEDAVDELIDEVSLAARPALDPSAPTVVYEVGDWSAAMQTELADALASSDIPYEWDERGDLVVLEEDEEAVSVVIDELPDPDDSMISSDDGVAVHELLDRVFMATDRLARDGGDASGTVALADAAEVLGNLALPFGFEPGQWRAFVSRVQGLRDLIEGTSAPTDADESADGYSPPVSDAEISAAAGELRLLVRQYV